MKKILLIICLLQSFSMIAQEEVSVTNDTIVGDFPCLICDFYNEINIVDRNYEYELVNKKHKLETWSIVVRVVGVGLYLGVGVTSFIVSLDKNLNIWTNSLCGIAAGVLVLYPFYYWSEKLYQRAKAIDIKPVVGYASDNTLGLILTVKF